MCDMVALFAPSLIKLLISSKKSPNGSILLLMPHLVASNNLPWHRLIRLICFKDAIAIAATTVLIYPRTQFARTEGEIVNKYICICKTCHWWTERNVTMCEIIFSLLLKSLLFLHLQQIRVRHEAAQINFYLKMFFPSGKLLQLQTAAFSPLSQEAV